jgi:hypothetical protein
MPNTTPSDALIALVHLGHRPTSTDGLRRERFEARQSWNRAAVRHIRGLRVGDLIPDNLMGDLVRRRGQYEAPLTALPVGMQAYEHVDGAIIREDAGLLGGLVVVRQG